MSGRHVIAAIAAALLVVPASAQARTVQQDLAVAQTYWHSSVCEGEWNVVADPGLAARGLNGEATGLALTPNPEGSYVAENGTRWDWRVERCEFSILPGLTGCEREKVIRHEMGHFVVGPAHTGRMDHRVLDRVPCEGERLDRAMRLRVLKRWRAHCHRLRITESTDWRAG